MEKLFELFYSSSGVCTDTRNITKDCLFICLKGANFNGNTFAAQAINDGAKYVIVDEEEYKTSDSIYFVPDALKFLQNLAHYHRSKFIIPVIGITGSNGKTSTKELINSVLSQKYCVLATKGNLNNHIGVPLTLLQLSSKHEVAIIEMGANRFKDIEELCEIAKPTHGIITNIGKAHLEGFGSFEGVLKTKLELYDSVSNSKGIIFYNIDDEILRANIPDSTGLATYGTNSEAKIIGELINLDPFVNLKWSMTDYSSPIVRTKMVGKYNFYNYLAAIAFGVTFKVSNEAINKAIENYTPENNRSQIKQTIKNTLILDCYNANPTSMRSALESFSMVEHTDKLFILGDMLELGKESNREHQAIAEYSRELGIKGITIGPIFKNFQSDNFIQQFSNKNEAIEFLKEESPEGKLILLKGSRGIGLETLEEYL